jgi:hypothetical protein
MLYIISLLINFLTFNELSVSRKQGDHILNIIGFDFRVMREREANFLILKCIEKRYTLFYGQNLELDIHLFVNGGSIN